MKTNGFIAFFIIITCFSANAADWESYDLINKLLALPGPQAPVIHEDYVIFTAPSDLRRVGVAFAHEKFSNIYYFRPMIVPEDPLVSMNEYKDSGIQFHVYKVPDNLNELEYRLVINGLWTTDPENQKTRRDPATGLAMSVLSIPPRKLPHDPLRGLPKGLHFSFNGPPGEIVTVAGNFNSWDPFMYELREWPEGVYSITIPLPPGTYQYVFFHRGERFTDPYNPNRVYSRDGSAASVIQVQ